MAIRILLAALLCLVSGVSWAQPVPPRGCPPSSLAGCTYASVNSSQYLGAPDRQLLTKSMIPFNPVYATDQAGVLYTRMEAIPLNALPYAVRIGITQPWAGIWAISSATVYFSDSYAGLVQLGTGSPPTPMLGTDSNNKTVIPTANSVYLSCTLTNSSTSVLCPGGTGTIPTASGTVYVIGPTGVPINATATIADSTHATLSGNFTGTTASYTVQFANLAASCPLYWDNSGAQVDTINTSGTARTFTLRGPTANTNTGINYPSTIAWSDLAPCNGVARSDGGTGYIAFVYVTQSTATTNYDRYSGGNTLISMPASAGYSGNTTQGYNVLYAQSLGGAYFFGTRPWNGGGSDYADNPAGTGWTPSSAQMPMVAVQYLTDTPSKQISQIGDSISAASAQNPFVNPIAIGCQNYSTAQAPCEFFSFAWGGQKSPLYDEMLRQNIAAVRPSALVSQPISRNETGGATLANFQTLISKTVSYANTYGLRIGYYGAFPLTTTIDGSTSLQAGVATMQARLLAISKTCQPSTGGTNCPRIPVLNPAPVISRAALGGNAWDYPKLGFIANGATAAGATTINITAGSVAPCYAGDLIQDVTTPSAIAAGATAVSSTGTTVTVANTAVVGGGILASDNLTCTQPGWSGVVTTYDNTHPWNDGVTALQSTSNIFVNQLLGVQ